MAMPTKAYAKFLKNMETVNRLEQTYDSMRAARHSRGKAAYDHITRSAIIFLASAFEVYIEDVVVECCNQHISFARDAKNLPGTVRDTLNKFVKNEKNGVPPTDLCDEGWRGVYRTIAQKNTGNLNTPKKQQITALFGELVGIHKPQIDAVPGMDDLDTVITFRGEIAHRVKASQYVTIDQVRTGVGIIVNLVVEIDKMILGYFKNMYPDKRLPWNNTY